MNRISMLKKASQTSLSAAPDAGPQGRINSVAAAADMPSAKCIPLFVHSVAGKRQFPSVPRTTNRYIAKIVSNPGDGRTTDTKKKKTPSPLVAEFFYVSVLPRGIGMRML
jgi:hypothetical protein